MGYLPLNIYWLIPEEASPCDIFLHFRGQFAPALQKGKPIPLETLDKIHRAKYMHVYIRESEKDAWDLYLQRRHTSGSAQEEEAKSAKSPYGNKRAEYLSYLQKTLTLKDPDEIKLSFAYQNAIQSIQKVIESPMLDWYFMQFHEPPDLFHHSARVTGLGAIFASLHPLLSPRELDHLIFSSVIHELSGDPKHSLKTVVSLQTVETLEKNGHPVPQEVIALIRDHDELCSGKGFPKNKKGGEIPPAARIFSFFNHFDHIRLQQSGTRRARHEAAKKVMLARSEDFEPGWASQFWAFLDKQVEILS